ncbi:TrkH family potassium uptake protein [Desulfovibrio litoralis]|uniref:Trk system potassium uptake protein TrkH n=1 Tax=Desulfovibrio litoralis DSM 11393 TaxID=1121455 RepID=A0A1M7S937_9BACT|nr:potassium transporter TrkG [Desulfovibrio litoralis]SHN54938.1 trk system potassium uptake protein TrkH [Desulfovibrio litoralis DSM 11393]
MKLTNITSFLGILCFLFSFTLIFPVFIALHYSEAQYLDFIHAILITASTGFILVAYSYFASKSKSFTQINLNHRESMFIVGTSWILSTIIGAIPFIIGADFTVANAIFESASGFSTTGSSILTDIEILPKSILFWRGFLNWFGGLGIVVFSLLIMPFLGVGGVQLFQAETTGIDDDKLKPRVKDTAFTLVKIYLGLTISLFVLLLFGGMDWFDSITHTFATVATGGFSTKNASVGAFDSAYIQWIIILFMILGGINFGLLYKGLVLRRFSAFFKNIELKVFLNTILISTTLVILIIYAAKSFQNLDLINTFEPTLRTVMFNLVSLLTTTGFSTYNYETWPQATFTIVLFLTFIGGCAGSTSGGLKCIRLFLLTQFAKKEIFTTVHPHAVRRIKIEGESVSADVLSGVFAFFILYIMIASIGTFVLTLQDIDILTAFSAVLTCIGNVGPGLGTVGPAENFNHLPDLSKYCLSLCMLLGRLEFFALLMLITPEFWRE